MTIYLNGLLLNEYGGLFGFLPRALRCIQTLRSRTSRSKSLHRNFEHALMRSKGLANRNKQEYYLAQARYFPSRDQATLRMLLWCARRDPMRCESQTEQMYYTHLLLARHGSPTFHSHPQPIYERSRETKVKEDLIESVYTHTQRQRERNEWQEWKGYCLIASAASEMLSRRRPRDVPYALRVSGQRHDLRELVSSASRHRCKIVLR